MSIFARNPNVPFSRSNPVSTILITLITAVYLLQLTPLDNVIRQYGALQGHLVIFEGQWWRIFTVMFLHGNIMHFAFNTFFGIYVISAALERIVGPLKFLVFFLGGGIIASFAVVAWDIVMENLVPTIGASGAIFAVLGVLLYLILNKAEWFSHSDAASIKAFVAINVVFTFIGANISIPGHIGGLIAGYLLAALLPTDKMGGGRRSSEFNDPFEQHYIDPASLDEVDVVDEDDDEDDDPFKDYPNW